MRAAGMRYYSGYSVIAGRELGKLSRASIAELPMLQEAGAALRVADTAFRSAAGIK